MTGKLLREKTEFIFRDIPSVVLVKNWRYKEYADRKKEKVI